MRIGFLATFVISLLSSTALANVVLNSNGLPLYKPGEVIVKYAENAIRTRSDMELLYSRVSVLDVKRFSSNFSSFEQLVIDSEVISVEAAIEELERDPAVEYAQPNYLVYAQPVKYEASPQEKCVVPGVPYPPGCEDNGGGNPPTPPPGGDEPGKCIIPGVPYPPGCKDEGGAPQPPGGGRPGNDPAISPAPEITPGADPSLDRAWGLSKINAEAAWKSHVGSKNMVVAVIDTGVDYNHPDLANNMWRNPNAKKFATSGIDPLGSLVTGDVVGYDFFHNDALPFDDHAHGTHCAGVIGAVGNNSKGIAGVSHEVSIMAIKFLSARGSGDTAGAIRSIDYAVERGANILSNSWGGPADNNNRALEEAVIRSQNAGALFVAAAGNSSADNDSKPMFPASFPQENVVSVAATSENDGLAYFSNYGKTTVDIGAPGTNIYSTTPNGQYQSMSGTSMAAPHVAGLAALVWSKNPNMSFTDVKRILLESGDSLGALRSKTLTGKRINALKALQSVN